VSEKKSKRATERQSWVERFVFWLARVTSVDVGKPDDGLVSMFSAGTEMDKPYEQLAAEFTDALAAWRTNPLARRIISLIGAYVVGAGMRLRAERPELADYLGVFWGHRQNRMVLRLLPWCEELARSGELFIALFTNPVDGMVYVRAISASRIVRIEVDPEDYEREQVFWEGGSLDEPDGRAWYAPDHPSAGEGPVMLHYAVNRPVGAVRGESDLASILPWLRRYTRWLEDRVRLNAGVRAFLWVVHAPSRVRSVLEEKYRQPPAAGSVIIADEAETWEAVAPNLRAADASNDGRAIRWMVAAGGPGTALIDFGEGEDSNLATARAMGEQRRRFLRQRQQYFGFVVADVAVQAWNRAVVLGKVSGPVATLADVVVELPDIAPEDNSELAGAAKEMADALTGLTGLVGESQALKRAAVRLVMKFAGETVSEEELNEMVDG